VVDRSSSNSKPLDGAGKLLRFALRSTLAVLAAGLLFELGTRALAFSDLGPEIVAKRFRSAGSYSHPEEDLYWWLRVRFGEGAAPRAIANYDAELGWAPWNMRDFVHPGEARLGERRPVLLYGDSFSACTTPGAECFQGLMERDPLGKTHCLLNLGAHAYGLDQIAMLIERTVDRFVERDPVVIVGLLVDRDLDRAGLTFRGTQNKPRFDLRGGELVLVPPRPNGVLPPLPPALLSLRLAVHALPVPGRVHDLFCGRRAAIERNRVRCRALLTSIVRGLEARGVESFFLLFHSLETLEERTWEGELVTRTLDELGERWISTRDPILTHARASGRELSEYFDVTEHFNALGNQVAFRAIREGLAGRSGSGSGTPWSQEELLGPLSPADFASVVVRGRGGSVRSRAALGGGAQAGLFISVGQKGPSEAHYELNGRARSFSASAGFFPLERFGDDGSVVLTILADGEAVLRQPLRRGDPPVSVQVDLGGRQGMTLRVDDGGDGTRGDWLLLTRPQFVTR